MFNRKSLMVLILVLLLGVMPVVAEDHMDDVSPVGTEEVVAPVVVVQDVGTANFVQVIIGLLTAFASGGIVGIAGLAIFVDRIRGDVGTVTALEKLAESYPPGTRDLLLHLSNSVESIGALGKEILDDVPLAEKIAPLT